MYLFQISRLLSPVNIPCILINTAAHVPSILNALLLLTANFLYTPLSGLRAVSYTHLYDDFVIQSEIKKGKSNLPDNKDDGEKALNVSSNNGNVDIMFVN